MSDVTREEKVWLYRKMSEIRAFEEASLAHFLQPGHGSHHPCIGHEAVEAAMGAALGESDYLLGSHRSHGHLLAKGLEPEKIMAELWGKETGLCRGRGGSMHVTDWSKRVLPSGIVGTSITLAVGVALAIQLRGGSEVALAAFGDGAANTGTFHEGLNMAALWRLPVVFVCENNGLAVSTHVADSTSVAELSSRACAYSMPGLTLDGTDPEASLLALREAIERARKGGGPSLIEALVPRWRGHAAWDRGRYLSEEEIDGLQARDPLPAYRRRLVEEDVLTQEQLEAIDQEMQARMAEAVDFAERSPAPALTKEEAVKYAFA